jgi:hypothetical protein
MCTGHGWRRAKFAVQFVGAPVSITLVALATLALLANLVTDHCSPPPPIAAAAAAATATATATAASSQFPSPLPPPPPISSVVPAVFPAAESQGGDGGAGYYSTGPPPQPSPPPPAAEAAAAALTATVEGEVDEAGEEEGEVVGADKWQVLESTIGCGLNSWVLTCYTNDRYEHFSASFVPRLFLWCLGSVGFDEYKVNMMFLLLLGPHCERPAAEGGLGALGAVGMLTLTALWGGIYALTMSSSSMIGSSALIFAVLLARVLPTPRDYGGQEERGRASSSSSSSRGAEFDTASLVVAGLFVAGQAKQSLLETLGQVWRPLRHYGRPL